MVIITNNCLFRFRVPKLKVLCTDLLKKVSYCCYYGFIVTYIVLMHDGLHESTEEHPLFQINPSIHEERMHDALPIF